MPAKPAHTAIFSYLTTIPPSNDGANPDNLHKLKSAKLELKSTFTGPGWMFGFIPVLMRMRSAAARFNIFRPVPPVAFPGCSLPTSAGMDLGQLRD